MGEWWPLYSDLRSHSCSNQNISIRSLIGVPLGGTILAASEGNYLGLILFSGLAYLIALVSFVVVRLMSVGVKVAEKF